MALFPTDIRRTGELWQFERDITVPGGGLAIIEVVPNWNVAIEPQEGIVAEGVTFRIVTHAAVADIELALRGTTSTVAHTLEATPHTAAGTSVHAFYPLNLIIKPVVLTGAGWAVVTGTFPAGDAMQISAWGYITPKTQLTSAVTPVSLEGYKWPLTRR